jgi:secretion/DNA translocation related TadE-like protein
MLRPRKTARRPSLDRTEDRGSVTIVVAGLLTVGLVFSLGVADLARVLAASGRAQTAADASALAAVEELAMGSGRDPAEPAREYAARNGASLVHCVCPTDGTEAIVEVRIRVGALLLLSDDRSVGASARAVVDLPSHPG